MTDENTVWEIIDLVIKEEIKENESIKSMGGSGIIQIKYSKIQDHELYYHSIQTDMGTAKTVSIPTLRLIIKELILHLRNNEDHE